jgi:cellulose synthase/poly-beta-1,6-N-acetylglucosamine synthase-like glycosyltransferase
LPPLALDASAIVLLFEVLWIITIVFLIPTFFLILLSKSLRPDNKKDSKRSKAYRYSGSKNHEIYSKKRDVFYDYINLPKITVVIPCYGEKISAIKATVKSVVRNGYDGEIELFVINDGKWDKKTYKKVRRNFTKLSTDRCHIDVHRNPKNIGKSESLNLGFKRAEGEIYFCVDADSRVKKGSIPKVVKVFLEDPKVGAAGGWVQIRLKKNISALQEIEYWTNQYMFRTLQNESKTVLTIPGPLSALRAQVADDLIDSTGEVFSSRTIVEDEDLTKYIVSKGYRTVVVPEAVVYTDCPQTLKALVVQRKRWFYGNYQAWRENRNDLKEKSKWGYRWGAFQYFTWMAGLISNFLLFFGIILAILYPMLSLRFLFIIGVFLLLRCRVLVEHPKSRKLMKNLPLSILYDAFLGLLASYLFLRYLLKTGVMIRWGGRNQYVV